MLRTVKLLLRSHVFDIIDLQLLVLWVLKNLISMLFRIVTGCGLSKCLAFYLNRMGLAGVGCTQDKKSGWGYDRGEDLY